MLDFNERVKPLDFIKYEKELKRDLRVNNFFDSFVLTSCVVEFGMYTKTFHNIASLIPFLVLSGLFSAKLTNIDKLMIADYIHEQITKTDTYKMSIEVYENYQRKLYEFITGKLGLSNEFEISYTFMEMLNNGILSNSGSHRYTLEYEKKKYTKYDIFELSGMRLATGHSVCRHRSKALVDLLSNINNDNLAIYLSYINAVKNKGKTSPYILKNLKPNHSNCLIIDKSTNNGLIVDPANNYIAGTGDLKILSSPNSSNDDLILYHKIHQKPGNDSTIKDNREDIMFFYQPRRFLRINNDKTYSGLTQDDYNLIKKSLNYDSKYTVNAINPYIKAREYLNFYKQTKPTLETMEKLYTDIIPINQKVLKKHIIK